MTFLYGKDLLSSPACKIFISRDDTRSRNSILLNPISVYFYKRCYTRINDVKGVKIHEG